LQTGRAGEAWELAFRADRSFDKYRLDQPVEGTTVILFRRGRAGEREAVAEAVRDALWRWCRYCPLEITFEDLERGEQPELIQDSPEPPEDALSRQHVQGDSHVRVTFGVPATAVLLRRGLILAEGTPRQLLPDIADTLGRSSHHLRVWADSPLLRTTLARDKVVDDEGRKKIERRVLSLRDELARDLLQRLEELAGETGAWTPDRHRRYGSYHAHVGLESIDEAGKPSDALVRRPLLRAARSERAWSLLSVDEWLRGRPLLVSAADFEAEEERALVDAAVAARVPVLAADLDDDRLWLDELVRPRKLTLLPVRDGLSRVEPRAQEAVGLCGLVEKLLQGAGLKRVRVRLGRFVDVDAVDPPVFGVEVGSEQNPLASFGGPSIPAAICREATLWLNRDQVLVQATMRSFTAAPLVAGMSLGLAMLGRMGADAPDPSALAEVAEDLRPPVTPGPTP
jgi:hypothetical protein